MYFIDCMIFVIKNKYWPLILLFILTLISTSSINAQKTKTVTGEGVGYNSDMLKAREAALFEAKKNAMQAAGVFEQVMSLSTIYVGNGKEVNKTHVEALSHLVIDGKVKLLSEPIVTYEAKDEVGLMMARCTIRAEVVLEEKQDPEFVISVDGFKSTYRDGDTLGFTFVASKDCYMRLFCFDYDVSDIVQGSMDYPTADGRFKDVKFKSNTVISFPSFYGAPEALLRACDWKVYNTGIDPIQTTFILIVALKRPLPFLGEVTYDKVLNWLYRIPANERCVHWQAIQIVK